jgi:hypothetical protein
VLESLVIKVGLLDLWQELFEWLKLQQALDVRESFEAAEGFEVTKGECNFWLVVGICELIGVFFMQFSRKILVLGTMSAL